VSQSSEFCRHNTLCCFSTSVYCCKRIFRHQLSPETFGYTLEWGAEKSHKQIQDTRSSNGYLMNSDHKCYTGSTRSNISMLTKKFLDNELSNRMEQYPSWQANSRSPYQKVPSFYGARKFITTHTKPAIWPYLDPDESSAVSLISHSLKIHSSLHQAISSLQVHRYLSSLP
jgi:hypothetical protein